MRNIVVAHSVFTSFIIASDFKELMLPFPHRPCNMSSNSWSANVWTFVIAWLFCHVPYRTAPSRAHICLTHNWKHFKIRNRWLELRDAGAAVIVIALMFVCVCVGWKRLMIVNYIATIIYKCNYVDEKNTGTLCVGMFFWGLDNLSSST